jgi:CxxC motif-containing protein (DUF1111 family)
MSARRSICWQRQFSLAAFLALAFSSPPARADNPQRVARGKELFVRVWTPFDEKSPRGDGLGPLFNAESCVACHAQGGVGGAGPNEVNVQLLTVTAASNPSGQVQSVRTRLTRVHPSFLTRSGINSTIVLHRHSTERAYGLWRDNLLSMKSASPDAIHPLLRLLPTWAMSSFLTPANRPSPHSTLLATEGLEFELTERNTPALFGAALVNAVSDKLLANLARKQARQFPAITGRVPRSIDGRLGRFGWRGQVSTVQDFVQNACTVELGLQLPGRSQAESPVADVFATVGKQFAKHPAPAHADMDAGQLMDLIAYVSSLPAPQQTRPKRALSLSLSREAGEDVFNNIGCAACHMRRVGRIDGIYSDLLLHDMGADLSDAAPAIPAGGPSVSFGGYYSGGSSVPSTPGTPITGSLAELRREWRTPPLWGVRDSAPYLHDGRAATLDEAIRAHGGEAEGVVTKFRALTAIERDSLLAFLDTLAAP